MWRFSDETEVDPGGEVRGASLFAQRLRHRLETGRARVTLWAQPSDSVDVDLAHTGHLDLWLRTMLDRENRIEGNPVRMVEHHSPLMPLPAPPWEPSDLVEGRVY